MLGIKNTTPIERVDTEKLTITGSIASYEFGRKPCWYKDCVYECSICRNEKLEVEN